uniref:Uncharacterized protein n=1 Tax=Acrobeloides nanus TaxID=290746 RepID=A0A914DUL9_9BILA
MSDNANYIDIILNGIDTIFDILMIVGVLTSLFLIILLIYFKVYHLNMRLLLINIPFTYIVILLAYIIKRIHERFGVLETINHYIDLFVDLAGYIDSTCLYRL